MKRSNIFLILLLAIFLVGLGAYHCAKYMHSTKKQLISPSQSWRYSDLFSQDSEPSWKDVKDIGISLTVPYSSDWRVFGIGLSVYDIDTPLEIDNPTIKFGKAIDNGTYITREYFLNKTNKKDFDTLKAELQNGCPNATSLEFLTFEKIQGIKHYSGGAKGCATGFAFNRGDFTYYLYRIAPIQESSPNIDEEMEKIIKSIH